VIASDPGLRKLLVWGWAVVNLAGAPLSVILPVAVTENVLGLTATKLSIVFVLLYTPATLGALIAMRMKISEPINALGLNLVAIAALLAGFGLLYTANPGSTAAKAILIALFAGTFLLAGLYNTVTAYAFQILTPKHVIMKVFSLRFLLGVLTTSVGSLVGAYIVENFGLTPPVAMIAGISILASVNLLKAKSP